MLSHTRMVNRIVLSALWYCFSAGYVFASESVVDLPARPGITQRILYLAPDSKPRAAAILFAGGNGALNIFPNGSIGWAERSFLVRNRARFVEHGIAIALLDAPSDKRAGLNGFRDSAEHAVDVASAIAWLREKVGAKVWLVGHSRGTESVVSATTRLGQSPKGPDGLVLTSSILSSTMFVSGAPVSQFPLEQIDVPVLILHHDADTCSVTLPRDLPLLTSRLPRSLPKKSVLMVSGGQASGSLCEMDSHHSFAGQDEAVIESIVKFITE